MRILLIALCLAATCPSGFAGELRGSLDADADPGIPGPVRVKSRPVQEKWGDLSSADLAQRLNGVWQGDGVALQIDANRAQANLRPGRPFHWERFIVKDATEKDVAFSIGSELFEAVVDGQDMKLAGTSFRGELTLRRQ
jgi:hypothetical protein